MLTLTLDPKKLPPNCDTVAYIRNSWAKFRVYIQREFKRPVQFIAILEFQANGRAHLHILIDRYVYDGWIRDQWQAVGGGKIIDIRTVDLHRIAAYLSKYLTKEMLEACPPRRRRISCCRMIRLFDRRPKTAWQWVRDPLWFFREMADQWLKDEQSDAQGTRFFAAEYDPSADSLAVFTPG
jgi:hypothetical protein